MKKLVLSSSNVHNLYESFCDNKLLSPKQYLYLLDVLIYTLLNEEITLQRNQSVTPQLKLNYSLTEAKPDLLVKVLYYMDATVGLNEDGSVPFLLGGLYKDQIMFVLSCLLQNKRVLCKRVRTPVSFLEKVYFSICTKLKMDKKDLVDEGYLFHHLQRLSKKEKKFTNQLFSVLGLKKISEVSLYSKYDHFDKEYCNNYRFIVTQSTSTLYPVGAFVFGTIVTKSSFVVLYKDSKCTLPIEDK
jgi:hypothetical protein